MRPRGILVLAALTLVLSSSIPVSAHAPAERGSWVSLQVQVDDSAMPLYSSADGTRYYVEARAGSHYVLRLTNRTGERVGVKIAVDGLNVISGERDLPGPGRMYILGPWESTSIRGWRTSLAEVRRFTFVDEKASYANRSGKANGKMGWIELAVYRELHRPEPMVEYDDREYPGAAAPAPKPEAKSRGEESGRADGFEGGRRSPAPSAPVESHPGTGWGRRLSDEVRLVDFDAEPHPIESVTLRYEYRAALVALGILPAPRHRDRLAERERGEWGFAKPPKY
jgi:hypothetical protein